MDAYKPSDFFVILQLYEKVTKYGQGCVGGGGGGGRGPSTPMSVLKELEGGEGVPRICSHNVDFNYWQWRIGEGGGRGVAPPALESISFFFSIQLQLNRPPNPHYPPPPSRWRRARPAPDWCICHALNVLVLPHI